VAGAVIGINPFDQPNVQESKDVTKAVIAKVQSEGKLPDEQSDVQADGIEVYGVPGATGLENAFESFFGDAKEGDFVCIMAYLTESPELDAELSTLQAHIRDATKLGTTRGYGPRFLHSTGQFHKGGPNNGFFIQLTGKDKDDVQLPGRSYTFGTFRDAQAIGDRQTLQKHGRRVIRVDLGSDPVAAVAHLVRGIAERMPAGRS
jgi:hypothetical protein